MGFRGGPPKAGQWHHLAVVFDGVIERVYVDGQLNNSEAKMLLMHEGRPVYVGASEPGTEFLDGYLASLRVYDAALSETAVKQLAADAPSADVLVHLDSAKLDYGRLASWENNGSLGGAFAGGNNSPVVEDVNGRIALKFAPGQSMEFVPGAEVSPIPEFTLMATVANPTLEAGRVCRGGGGCGGQASRPARGTAGWGLAAGGGGLSWRTRSSLHQWHRFRSFHAAGPRTAQVHPPGWRAAIYGRPLTEFNSSVARCPPRRFLNCTPSGRANGSGPLQIRRRLRRSPLR